ncbi:hypothetical protein AB0M22_45020 [Nocardia sp. NPDC051756]|uniref:hypothetical protein n=1 Tax=Nocardia sp. NPDC051756 TaxID=3154751 RepID=UPI00342FFAAE
MVDSNEFQRATYAWQWGAILTTSSVEKFRDIPPGWIADHLETRHGLDPRRPLAYLAALAALDVSGEPEVCRDLHALAVEGVFFYGDTADVLVNEPAHLSRDPQVRAKELTELRKAVLDDLACVRRYVPSQLTEHFWFPV